MTTDAVPRDVVVVEVRRRPTDGRVTVVAGLATLDMADVLPLGGASVVTTGAGADHLQVVDACHGSE